MRALTALALLVALVGAAPAEAKNPDRQVDDGATVVRVAQGAFRGAVSGEVREFRGIPYAAPPVGARRLRSPAPPRRWKGLRDATAPGARCLQPDETGDGVIGNEDCLFLDVTTPRRISREGHGHLPVLVFLHGGGLDSGGGDAYDPRRLVEAGAVTVTVNYRLGALGWMAHPGLRDRAEGNFGLADQRAALRWVRRNIAAFGGDRHNVTLWGQSAGAFSTCAHIASSSARHLFDKAIVQSGPCGIDLLTRQEARTRGRGLADRVGCSGPRTGACLRSVPAATLLTQSPERPDLPLRQTDLPWTPVVGTHLLARQPLDAFRSGAADGLPLLQGGTRDELHGYYSRLFGDLTREEYAAAIHERYGAAAPRVLARYDADDYALPGVALAAVATDQGSFLGACTQFTANEAIGTPTVHAYEFAEPTESPDGGFPLGAYHSSDLRFLMDSNDDGPWTPPPLTPEEEPLGELMVSAWTTFGRTGTPGPGWPSYDAGIGTRLTIDHTGPVDLHADHHCDLWDALARRR